MCPPVCPHVSVVAGACVTGCACMSSAAVARSVSDCPQPLRFVAVSLSAALSAAVSLTAVSSLASLGLFMSQTLWVCLYPSCVSLCLSPYVSPSTQVSPCVLLTTQATGGRVGPTGAQSCGPAHPTLALPWARLGACLQCLPQVNTKIRNTRATSLTSAPCPLACPGLGWPRAP